MSEESKDKGTKKQEIVEDVKKKNEKISYSRQPERQRGTIGFDIIRKDVIRREKKAQANWPIRFGHLSSENFKKVLIEECENIGIPTDTFEHKKKVTSSTRESPIILKPSPSIPRTSSADVGWRSSLPDHNLEFLGRLYISPTKTIEPPLQPGQFRVTDQKFIFLG